MDPSDPVWQQTGIPPSDDSGPQPGDADGSEGVEFVDFADPEGIESGPPERVEEMTPRRYLLLVFLPLGFTFLLTSLFLAMRGVMELGGMVAIGGPYEIAHPAPGYWWIFPVAIIGCVLIVFTSMGMFSVGAGKIDLVVAFFWPAIFLSLSWNFLEYGFFNGEGLAWGWIICGVAFVLMGAIPLYLVAKSTTWNQVMGKISKDRRTLMPQIIGAAVGIPLGILFFSLVS
jgi:hypothetical protein